MNQRISSHRNRIDNLFNRVTSFENLKDQSEWSRYLCILVSGYIEESLRVLLEKYVSRKTSASSPIKNFVSGHIEDITNCKTEKILKILGSFDSTWQDKFRTQLAEDEEMKESIDGVVANRHQIAHGKNMGISYVTVKKYYKNVKKAIEVLEMIVK